MHNIRFIFFLFILLCPTIGYSQSTTDSLKMTVSYHYNGKIAEEGQVDKEGKRTGNWKIYHDNGQLHSQINYQNGLAEGDVRFFGDEGQLTAHGKYKKGYKVGKWLEYFSNSNQLRTEIFYSEEEIAIGPYKEYYPNGQLKDSTFYSTEGRELASKYFYSNGQLQREISFSPKSHKRNGHWTVYYTNGQLKEQTFYNEGEECNKVTYFENGQLEQYLDKTIQKEYYDNGQEKVVLKKQDGQYIGKFTRYYANGQIEAKGAYCKGKRCGNWQFYYENGQVKFDGRFKNDLIIGKAKYYTKEGKAIGSL